MFPFKTRQFSFTTNLTTEQLKDRLSAKVCKWKLISISTDGEFYGTLKNKSATIAVGQSFQRNSFRPVVVFKWSDNNSRTEIKGYYRVALSVILTTLFIPLFGLYLTIKIENILPLLFLVITWTLMYLTLGRWLFNKDYKWTEAEFFKLVCKEASTQQRFGNSGADTCI